MNFSATNLRARPRRLYYTKEGYFHLLLGLDRRKRQEI